MNASGKNYVERLGRQIARHSKTAMAGSLLCVTLLIVFGECKTAFGQARRETWNATDGDWTDPMKWRPRRVPDPNTDVRLTNGQPGTKATTTLQLTKQVDITGLTIGPDNIFSVSQDNKPRNFTVTKDMTNNGTLNLSLGRSGTFTVKGTFTNAGTIKGSGILGKGKALNNSGVIDADGGTLLINKATITNTGEMTATKGILRLDSSMIDNTNGKISGGNKGFSVELIEGTVKGGTLIGPIYGRGTTLQDLTLVGSYNVWSTPRPQTPGRTTLEGTITLGDGKNSSATINVDNDAKLFIRGQTTLTGKGTVRLTDDTSIIETFPLATPVATLTIDKDLTVEGSGLIGNGNLSLINRGLILAEKGNEIVVNPGKGNKATNVARATMKADKGGTLILKGAISNQGVIEATGKNSTVDITDANVDNLPTHDKDGTVNGTGKAKVSVNFSVLDNLAINMTSGSSLDSAGSTVYGGSITASNALINFNNTTVSNDALAILSNGILQMEGSTISAGSLALSGSSTVLADGGTSNIALSIVDPGRLTVTPDAMLQILQDQETGGRTTVDGILQAPNGLTVARGTLTGSGAIIGNLMLAGVLKPGNSGPGSISIQGNYSQSSPGLLDEDLVGSSQYNITDITQSATLGGTLYIHLSDGFTPVMGETFQIMDFASSTGTFDNVLGEYIGDGEKIDVIYNPTNVTLEVEPVGATPEPGSLFLFGSGVIGLSAFLRKRLHKTA